MLPKLIIFDVDGLMLDTESKWQEAWQTVGNRYGVSDLGKTTFMKCVGRNGKEVESIIEEDLKNFDNPKMILKEVREYGNKLLNEKISTKKGLFELLDFIKTLSIPIAVATATEKTTTYERLSKLHLLDYFDYILCGNEVHLRKPNPEIYQKVLQYFHIMPQDALILEDSYVGVEAAYRANVPCIMIPDLAPACEKQRNETIAVVSSLLDVIDILKEKNKKETMLTYIRETPYQLKSNVNNIKEITEPLVSLYLKKRYQSLWIIACGSSFNGAQCAKPFLMKYLNCDIKVISPMSFVYFENQITEDDFVFVVSQSGHSTNCIQALQKLKSLHREAVLITGQKNDDLKSYADIVVDYHMGIETVGYVTKGIVMLIEYLILFALVSGLKKHCINQGVYDEIINELLEVPERHQIIQEETKRFYQKHLYEMTSLNPTFFIGFIQSYGIALEGALKMAETTKHPCMAYEAEEFIHGFNLQLTPAYTVWCIDDCSQGSSRIIQNYKAIQSVTPRTYAITNSPLVDDEHAIRMPFHIHEPLLMPLYILPVFQVLSYQISEELQTWNTHPRFSKFNDYVQTKTKK